MRIPLVPSILLLIGAVSPVQAQVTLSISSDMDIYQAGGYDDGTGAARPFRYPIAAGVGTVTFPAVTGQWTCQSDLPYYTADGTTLPGNCLSGGRDIVATGETLAQYASTDFAGALVGVFLDNGPPSTQPTGLRFYVADSSSGGIQTNFAALRPRLGQVFFIGDGRTGTGTGGVQTFFVPANATALYLGYADACTGDPQPSCFGDNAGAISVTVASRPLPGLCSTGQTAATNVGCTGQLVPPTAPGAVANHDGNWDVTYAPLSAEGLPDPCSLSNYVSAWVNTPYAGWLPNLVSKSSEWIGPLGGNVAAQPGWYVYRVRFPVPLPSGGTSPTLTINGQLSSDSSTLGVFLESPAGNNRCVAVTGQTFPVNPATTSGTEYQRWWPFSFTNAATIVPGDAYLYFVVRNSASSGVSSPYSPTGFRVEFEASSYF